jgi:hypothetical protein
MFKITIGLPVDPIILNDYPRKFLLSLAQKLTEPSCTDVEFTFPSEGDGKVRKLYAMSRILEDRSQYFHRSICTFL